MATDGVADEQDTLDYLLTKSKRTAIPVRHAFVHEPSRGGGKGPLASFMRRPDALDLHLLLLAVAIREPHSIRLPAAVWSRALGRGDSTNAELWVSKNLRWLEEQKLITRQRAGRLREITIRHDSGLDKEYTRPDGKQRRDWFLNLPHAYFLDGWHKKLSASGKAVLLIAHANKPDFELNQRQGEIWWGLSTDTLGRGLRELQDEGILTARTITRKAPESRTGTTTVPRYTLVGALAKRTASGRPAQPKPKTKAPAPKQKRRSSR